MFSDNTVEYNLLENLKNSKGNLYKLKSKISIFGCNDIGISCAVALMYSKLSIEICLIDPYNEDKLNSEILDLEHCVPAGITLTSSVDIDDSVGSDICIMCVDKAANDGLFICREDFETILLTTSIDTIRYNAIEYKKIIPIITKKSPNTIFIIALYPYSYMSYITWKSSKLPINRIIGIGTSIETLQFRHKLAKVFNVSPLSVNGYVIGAMRYNVPVYSEAKIAGAELMHINVDGINIFNMVNKVFETRRERFNEKGDPHYFIGSILCKLIKSILTDSKELFTVSTKNRGYYGLKRDLFLSLPTLIGRNGVHTIINPTLNNFELDTVQKASNRLYDKVYQKI